MVTQYRDAALAGATSSHPPIPILFGIDAVHGNAKIPGATIFPHNVGLGAAHDAGLIRQIGKATAEEVSAIGIDWAFAPTVAVARDPRWGRAYESYSSDPALVAGYASAMVTGLQGQLGTPDFFAPGHVLSSAKHFIGDGGTENGRDQGDNLASEDILRDVHGAGYRAAISAGVGTVMASYNSWRGEKMHANTSLLTGVLKQRWQFNGFVIGDWNAQEEIPGCTKFSCARAVNAGVDMVMAPDSWKEMYANLLSQARAGLITTARIDDAVRRILRVKAAAGLIGPTAHVTRGGDFSSIGSPAHRALAREAVWKSLVLLKNESGVLPLARDRHILVVGEAADRIDQQCGGWTLDWQGSNHSNADIAGATSLFAGIKAAVAQGGGTAVLSPDGTFVQKPDAAIVVFGEHPYAEFEGDRDNLALPGDDHIRMILQRLQAQHIPVVSVLLSGRPLWVNPELNLSDAFVAAWLPGSEGEGVADVLFRSGAGTPAHNFTGRLSFPWPASAMPVTYDLQGHVSGALFTEGYGLDYTHAAPVPHLSEDPKISPIRRVGDVLFQDGHVFAPWSVYVTDDLAQVRLTRTEQSSPNGDLRTSRQNNDISADWSGKAEAEWWIGDTQIDLSARAKAGAVLSLTYRLTQTPTEKMLLGMQCGHMCGGWLDVTAKLGKPATNWRTLTIPLSCFASHGADMSGIDVPFALKTFGRAAISMRDISIVDGSVPTSCPAG
jgi:beta-glucosidase